MLVMSAGLGCKGHGFEACFRVIRTVQVEFGSFEALESRIRCCLLAGTIGTMGCLCFQGRGTRFSLGRTSSE